MMNAFTFLLLAPAMATIDAPRIHVGDLAPQKIEAIAAVDLGPAPPPGQTRLVGRSEVQSALARAGLSPAGANIPESVRVVRASRRLSADALAKLLAPLVEKKLRPGVSIAKLEPTGELVVAPSAAPRAIAVPEIPRHQGPFRTTVSVEIAAEGDAPVRVFVPLLVEVSEAGARPDAARGGRVELTIERGGMVLTATAVAMSDVSVGETAAFQIAATARVVRAKLIAPGRASMEAP